MFRAGLLILVLVFTSGCAAFKQWFQEFGEIFEPVGSIEHPIQAKGWMPGCMNVGVRNGIRFPKCPSPSKGRPVGNMSPEARVVRINCCYDHSHHCAPMAFDINSCHGDSNCRLECAVNEPRAPLPQYTDDAGSLCSHWHQIAQRKTISDRHHATADHFDSSPQARCASQTPVPSRSKLKLARPPACLTSRDRPRPSSRKRWKTVACGMSETAEMETRSL